MNIKYLFAEKEYFNRRGCRLFKPDIKYILPSIDDVIYKDGILNFQDVDLSNHEIFILKDDSNENEIAFSKVKVLGYYNETNWRKKIKKLLAIT